MPTTNPRINVTVSPSLDLLVARLAEHQNLSKSQVLRELLETAEPALQRVVALMDAAQQASSEVRTGLARSLERAQDQCEDALYGVLGRLEQPDLLSGAEKVKGRKRATSGARNERRAAPVSGDSGVLTPPPLTGGSGQGTKGSGTRVRRLAKGG